MQYCAVIGDIIGSRNMEAEARARLQARLERVLEDINSGYHFEIAARFLITLGDEFQGLLYFSGPAAEIVERIARAVYPAKLRYGIGIGEISTEIDPDKAIGADGPAFHRARDCVERLRARGARGFPVLIGTGETEDALLDGMCLLLDGLVSGWSASQAECVRMMRLMGEQLAVAERLGLAPSTVSRTLARAQYHVYENALAQLNTFLDALDDSRPDTPLRQAQRVIQQCGRLSEYRKWDEVIQKIGAFMRKPAFQQLPAKNQISCFRILGQARSARGELASAIAALQEGFRLARREKQPETETVLLNDLAVVYTKRDDFTDAERVLAEAQERIDAYALPPHVQDAVRGNYAALYQKLGEYAKAIEIYRSLLNELPEEDDTDFSANSHFNLAGVLIEMNEDAEALEHVRAALENYRKIYPDTDIRMAKAYGMLAGLLRRDDPQRAAYWKKALAGAQKNRAWDMVKDAAAQLQRDYEDAGAALQAAEYARIVRQAEKRARQADAASQGRGEE